MISGPSPTFRTAEPKPSRNSGAGTPDARLVVLRGAEAAYVNRQRGPALLATGAEQVAGVPAPFPVLRHADRVRALVEEVELLHRLARVLDVLGERLHLLLEVLDPVAH